MASRRANPTLIGVFVIGAVAIAVAVALVLGSGTFLRESSRWVIYFESSVVGLDTGSPVVFRGVTVGSVTEIQAYANPEERIFASPVYIQLLRGTVEIASEADGGDPLKLMTRWIERDGLRAQLKSQSLITGKLYIELAFHEDLAGQPVEYKRLHPEVAEIPSVPTQMEQIAQTLDAAIRRIAALPIEEIVNNLNRTLNATADRMSDPKLADAIANLDAALKDTRSLVGRIDASYDQLDDDLRATLASARGAIDQFDAAVGDARLLIEPGSPLQYQLITALDELIRAARSLRVLSDSIASDPNQLIFGRRERGAQP